MIYTGGAPLDILATYRPEHPTPFRVLLVECPFCGRPHRYPLPDHERVLWPARCRGGVFRLHLHKRRIQAAPTG